MSNCSFNITCKWLKHSCYKNVSDSFSSWHIWIMKEARVLTVDLRLSRHTEKDRFIPSCYWNVQRSWQEVMYSDGKQPTVFNDVNVYVVKYWLFCTECISSMCIRWNQFYYQYDDTIEFWCECFKLWFQFFFYDPHMMIMKWNVQHIKRS